MKHSILVIGLGELGTEILQSIVAHPAFSQGPYSLIIMQRPSSRGNSEKIQHFQDHGAQLISGDIVEDSLEALKVKLSAFTAVIHASGMYLPPGSFVKLARAVLEAGVEHYFPWQFGVDYDVIGREGGQGMFSEQIEVREMLRSQKKTQWLIISCGLFMSFLFEDFWGVVTRAANRKLKVTALNSWQDWVTATTARDIGHCTAELLFRPEAPRDSVVFIAGDTMTFSELADTVQEATGEEVERVVWPLEYLREESKNAPNDKLKKYRVVFSEGKGLSWPKEGTWSAQNGIEMESIAEWLRSGNFH